MFEAGIKSIQRMANRVGVDVGRYPRWGKSEWYISKLLPSLNIDCLIDVGGHVGNFGASLRSLGYQGDIISFEPVPENFKALSDRSESDPKWHVINTAVGNTHGTLPLNISDETVFSSFLTTNMTSASDFETEMTLNRVEMVEVARLDALLEGIDVARQAKKFFLKSDTQGFDLNVIEGLGDQVSKVQGIQIEVPIIHLYEGMTGFNESISHVQGLGFEIFGLAPVGTDHSFRTTEYDCFFRRIGA